MVEAGAAPRVQLDQAEELLADSQDMAVLQRTLYADDLRQSETVAMIAAAERRLERRTKALAKAQKLVEGGVLPRQSLGTYQEEVEMCRRELAVANSRADLVRELAALARGAAPPLARGRSLFSGLTERYSGKGALSARDLSGLERAFHSKFFKALPISAQGDTALHRALGFDHRSRVDVAIHPDQPEGIWLMKYLTEHRIPYVAFRHAVPGRATAAHIHVGPQSTRISRVWAMAPGPLAYRRGSAAY